MNNNETYDLKLILSAAREKKGLSQRKLARIIGIHHSSLNDLENGKIKKIDIEILRKLAEELDLSLVLLMKASGYSEVAFMFNRADSLDNKSTRDLKDLIKKYKLSQLDLLDDAFQKRRNVRKCRIKLNSLITKLEDYDNFKDIWTIKKITEELNDISDELIKSALKYDYTKLPKDNT